MAAKSQQFIIFKLADRIWASPLSQDSQFFSCEHLSALPLNNKYIAGLTYLNGQLLTVLRTDKFLGLTFKMPTHPQCLQFSYRGDFYALVVEEGLDTVSVNQIFSEKTKNIANQYIKLNKEKIYIIEPEKIFAELKIYV